MRNNHRTARISIRCQPDERDRLIHMADLYSLTTADFLRQAVVIATAKHCDKHAWRRAYIAAITRATKRTYGES